MDKRIKILYTIPNFDTAGSGKVVYDLVKGLDKTLFEPEICCFHTRGDFFREIKKLGVKIHEFSFAQPYKPLITLPFRVFKIYRFFRKHHFDLIHSWHWSSDITEPLAAKLAGIPFVYTKKAMGWGNKAWVWRSRLSARIIVVNGDMENKFFFNMPNKIVKIPLGVDTDYFKPQLPPQDLKQDLDIKDADFVIVSVANLVPIKGIETLLEAVLKLQNLSIKVLIVGNYNSPYGNQVKNKYNSDNNIKFLGYKQDVRPYLAFADVYIIPTLDRGEGLPIAPLEAMVSGCIVLGSNVSGIKDILSEFQECLFNPSSLVDVCSKIKYIINLTDNERQDLGRRMQNSVSNKFSLNESLLAHNQLYKKIVQ